MAELAARFPITVLTQPNAGLGAARNFGIRAEPRQLRLPARRRQRRRARLRRPLRRGARGAARAGLRDRLVALRGRERRSAPGDEGFQPLGAGHSPEANAEHNLAGDAAALVRRRVFDLGFAYSEELTSYEDWHFYRELELAGHRGAVIPERLIRYRVHPEQMTRQVALEHRRRIEAEIEAHIRENSVQWTSSSA